MGNNVFEPSPDEICEIYKEAFMVLEPGRRPPSVDIRFYPYVGINHTIRLRNGRIFVRISELCYDMPRSAHRGLAHILVAKLLRRRVSTEADRAYSVYVDSPALRDRAARSRRERGRKMLTSPKGEFYDLDEIFDSLNFWYFGGRLEKPVLTWSQKMTYHILGHHDATHDTVSISRSLDARNVPSFVVEYVLYHEMLHIAHPAVHQNGRRYHHTAAFKRDERRFLHFHKAEKWINDNVANLRRAAKRRRK